MAAIARLAATIVLPLPLSLLSILTFFPPPCAAFPQDRPSQDRILAVAAPNNSVAWMVYVQVSCYQPLKLQHFPFDRSGSAGDNSFVAWMVCSHQQL